MKVVFKTLSAGPQGVIRPGDVVDVSEAEGKLLLAAGYAEAMEPEQRTSVPLPAHQHGMSPPEPVRTETGKPQPHNTKPAARNKR